MFKNKDKGYCLHELWCVSTTLKQCFQGASCVCPLSLCMCGHCFESTGVDLAVSGCIRWRNTESLLPPFDLTFTKGVCLPGSPGERKPVASTVAWKTEGSPHYLMEKRNKITHLRIWLSNYWTAEVVTLVVADHYFSPVLDYTWKVCSSRVLQAANCRVSKGKPTQKCLKPAFFLMATGGDYLVKKQSLIV